MKFPIEYQIGQNKIIVREDSFAMETEGITVFSFPIRSQVAVEGKKDIDLILTPPEVTDNENGLAVRWNAVSEAWLKKTYMLDLYPDGFYFRIKVKGNGRPDAVRFFTGDPNAMFPGSEYEAAGYALPEVAYCDGVRMTRLIDHDGRIAKGFMTPPSFVFPFWTTGIDEWVGIGLVAEEGQHQFHSFLYKNHNNRCHFEVSLDRRTLVDGEWLSQGIWGGFGSDVPDIVKRYGNFYYHHRLCKEGPTKKYRWWKGPFYCGWGDQVEVGQSQRINIKDKATQEFYEKMSRRLDELDLHPTAIIIDDKWQGKYGQLLPDNKKWPDMRAFTDAQHAKNRRVILWVKVWNAEGLDEDECITLEQQPYIADPTNPKYRKRVFETVKRLLSDEEGCYNCDGFKLDFVNCFEIHPELRSYDRSVYGMELMKTMLKLFYDAAKAVKPDALINNSCAHPYFAEVCDQARLHDYGDEMRSLMPIMEYRKSLFAAALPNALIDTDSANRSNYREAKEYCLRAHELGVPDIYMIQDCREYAFSKEDWAEIRNVWEDYAKRMDEQGEV